MKIKSFLRGASVAAAIAAAAMNGGAVQAQTVLPTGASITPTAATGSVYQSLTVALPDYPNYSPDSAETTAISPDGKTLLILTSGFNLNLDSNGNHQPQDSGEYVFVYDLSQPSVPVQKQVVQLVASVLSEATPISEAEQYYEALKLRKIESVLVRFPGEPHGMSTRPSHQIAKILYVSDWFDQHRKKIVTLRPARPTQRLQRPVA
jgi:hypothetical protein